MNLDKLLMAVAFLAIVTVGTGCGDGDPATSPYDAYGTRYLRNTVTTYSNYAPPSHYVPARNFTRTIRYDYYLDPAYYAPEFFGYGYVSPAVFVQRYPVYLSSAPTILLGVSPLLSISDLAKRIGYSLASWPLRALCGHGVSIATGYCPHCYSSAYVIPLNRAAGFLDKASWHLVEGETQAMEMMLGKARDELSQINLPQARKISNLLPSQGRLSTEELGGRLVEARLLADQLRFHR